MAKILKPFKIQPVPHLKGKNVTEVKLDDPIKQLQQEFWQLCAQLGNLHYRHAIEQEEIKKLVEKAQTINQKGAELQKAKEEKKDEAPKNE